VQRPSGAREYQDGTPNFVGPLAGKTIADLLTAIREDRAYVNVHTQQFPAGDIRGRLK
jgi:hypothetical protein